MGVQAHILTGGIHISTSRGRRGHIKCSVHDGFPILEINGSQVGCAKSCLGSMKSQDYAEDSKRCKRKHSYYNRYRLSLPPLAPPLEYYLRQCDSVLNLIIYDKIPWLTTLLIHFWVFNFAFQSSNIGRNKKKPETKRTNYFTTWKLPIQSGPSGEVAAYCVLHRK